MNSSILPIINCRLFKNNYLLETTEPNLSHDFYSQSSDIDISQIPELKKVSFSDQRIHLYDKLDLLYSINPTYEDKSIITALCVDGRTSSIELLSKESIPQGYEIVFLLYSTLFVGKTNTSRQELTLTDNELNTVKKVFRERVAEIINNEIPDIQERNKEVKKSLFNRYPHLYGYFDSESIGLVDRNELLKEAQSKFFHAQKDILEANGLTNDQYEKSIEISSRLLTEYILYRNIIIKKLETVNSKNTEADIHNIIVPMRKTFRKDALISDIYNNNAWLLDDKYMTYNTILSDEEMDKLVLEIAIEGDNIKKDDTRPDIALVFSANPNISDIKFDVVIVELKKMGLNLAKKEELISQLRQRARKLLNYYPKQIQRIWFYGIVDFDDEFERSLKEDDYLEVFSIDKHYYKELKIIPDYDTNEKVLVGVHLLSFNSFLKDADSRNSTFLNLLKEGLKNNIPSENFEDEMVSFSVI